MPHQGHQFTQDEARHARDAQARYNATVVYTTDFGWRPAEYAVDRSTGRRYASAFAMPWGDNVGYAVISGHRSTEPEHAGKPHRLTLPDGTVTYHATAAEAVNAAHAAAKAACDRRSAAYRASPAGQTAARLDALAALYRAMRGGQL